MNSAPLMLNSIGQFCPLANVGVEKGGQAQFLLFPGPFFPFSYAAVVGILGAALYQPVWTSSVAAPTDFAIALTAFLLLSAWKTPP
jgi:hypothetical protein